MIRQNQNLPFSAYMRRKLYADWFQAIFLTPIVIKMNVFGPIVNSYNVYYSYLLGKTLDIHDKTIYRTRVFYEEVFAHKSLLCMYKDALNFKKFQKSTFNELCVAHFLFIFS